MGISTAIVGGGIVGLALSRALLRRHPDARVDVLEKEAGPARHQTGRNSGVLHSGVYYPPGSAKARTCALGKALIEDYARSRGLPFELCGKVVVATAEDEIPRLEALASRARVNGIDASPIGPAELRELEPHVVGLAALHVPSTGIIDYGAVCEALAEDLRASGRGALRTRQEVTHITRDEHDCLVSTRGGAAPLAYDRVVNCAGLHSDRVAAHTRSRPGAQRGARAREDARIVPFRGEYHRLRSDAEHLVRGLVYPVPDPRFPFLGVHFTRMIDGGVECGPNAVFALAREGYAWTDVSARDLASSLSWPGTWRLFRRHWRTGLGEVHRSLSKRALVRALQRLVPDIRAAHLEPAPAGVRAQALARDGALVDDFRVARDGPVVHVLNAPSPAATASFAIAEWIADTLDA